MDKGGYYTVAQLFQDGPARPNAASRIGHSWVGKTGFHYRRKIRIGGPVMKHVKVVSRKPAKAQDIPISVVLTALAEIIGVLAGALALKEQASA